MTKKELEAQLSRMYRLHVAMNTAFHVMLADNEALLCIVEKLVESTGQNPASGETLRQVFFRYRVRELERRVLEVGDEDPQLAEEMQKVIERWRRRPGAADKF